MNSSPTITKIAAALVKAQGEMGNAKKESVNPFFKKSYADLNSVREATLPVLNSNGISVIQPTCVIEGVNYVETILLHESGEFISSLTQIITDKPNDAQRHGSGLSYARRYALASIVNIGAEDDDANAANDKSHTNNKPTSKITKWQFTPDLKNELTTLAETATLDDNGRFAAENAIENMKTEKEFEAIKVRLIQLQPLPV